MIRYFIFFVLSIHCSILANDFNQLIHPTASLLFILEEKLPEDDSKKVINPSSHQIHSLWNKISDSIFLLPLEEQKLKKNYARFCLAETLEASGEFKKAKKIFKKVKKELSHLWSQAIAQEEIITQAYDAPILHFQADQGFEANPSIPQKIRKQMSPYIIPNYHPLKETLDRIFYASRATFSMNSAAHAGFSVIATGPRSHVVVAKHAELPGHLIKFHCDNDPHEKRERPSWEWLTKRCEGSEKIRKILTRYQIKYFVCAKKYLYILPPHPRDSKKENDMNHLACLLVTDMQLEPTKVNLFAWKNKITKKHLDELYLIISRGKGSSYRPDNINYNKDGKFAFIDTEYPDQKPDYKRIREYLSPKMRDYWDDLVTNGGK